MTMLTELEISVLKKLEDCLNHPCKRDSPVLQGMHRMGYIRLYDELCGPLALKSGEKIAKITSKGLEYLTSLQEGTK